MQAPLTLLRAAFVRQPFRLGQGVVVMGWSGLTLVLMRVQALSSARVGGLTQTLVWLSAGVASGVLVLLLLALAAQTALRFFSRPSPLGESELALERRRIPSLSASAALAVGMILLASVWFQLGYPSASGLLWCLGASLEALTSGVVFCRLFQARGQEGFWAQITPTLLIPAVGNALVVLAALAGFFAVAISGILSRPHAPMELLFQQSNFAVFAETRKIVGAVDVNHVIQRLVFAPRGIELHLPCQERFENGGILFAVFRQ